ncbi:hypothetical protein APSETT444_002349 [Aspergillus pseudonomiae]
MPVVASASVPSIPLTKGPSSLPAKRLQPAHTAESPAKKQSKWSPEEDALIIELRGSGMKWEDISKRLPGRSAISCRLHYQNYLERRSEWDEDKKNKLARLYERQVIQSRDVVQSSGRDGNPVASCRSYALAARRARNGAPSWRSTLFVIKFSYRPANTSGTKN